MRQHKSSPGLNPSRGAKRDLATVRTFSLPPDRDKAWELAERARIDAEREEEARRAAIFESKKRVRLTRASKPARWIESTEGDE